MQTGEGRGSKIRKIIKRNMWMSPKGQKLLTFKSSQKQCAAVSTKALLMTVPVHCGSSHIYRIKIECVRSGPGSQIWMFTAFTIQLTILIFLPDLNSVLLFFSVMRTSGPLFFGAWPFMTFLRDVSNCLTFKRANWIVGFLLGDVFPHSIPPSSMFPHTSLHL